MELYFMIQLEKAVQVLKAGGIVVYPTDTAYGLAADAMNPSAVKKLYALKGRDFKKPIHVICPSKYYHTSNDGSVCPVRINQPARKLIKKFWPGPLTIVLPLRAKGKSWQMLSAGTKTLVVRMPNNQTALALVERFGKPITTTSANLAGQSACYSVEEVRKQFGSRIYARIYGRIYVLDGGKLPKTKPSTIVSLLNGRVRILRVGPISEKQIKKALN